jgi:hypothetical protein
MSSITITAAEPTRIADARPTDNERLVWIIVSVAFLLRFGWMLLAHA